MKPETETKAHWRVDARQQRSRRTEAALARAAQRLAANRPFDEIRVEELTREAGVSVGTFYRRFRDKRALLHVFDAAVLDDCRAALDLAMSDRRMRGRSLEDVVHAYVAVMIRKFREHRIAILQVLRNADPQDGAAFGSRAREFNDHVHGRFRELLRERAAEIAHPDLETALNLAIFFASAAARDAVWRGALGAYPVAVDDERLVDEITRAFVAYLRA